MNEFTVLLSRKFKEAHNAFRGKRTMDPHTEEWVESMKRTNNTAPTLTAGEGSSKGMVMEERDNKGVLGGISENWSMFPHSTGNSFNVQPHSSSNLLYATNNGSGGAHQHHQTFSPYFTNFQLYNHAWEVSYVKFILCVSASASKWRKIYQN